MKKTRLLGAVCACLIATSLNLNAAIVDNGTYTTVNGVDWLDLTETKGMSYDQVSAQLGSGGALEGWSYATRDQIAEFWDAFGGDSNYYNGWSTQNQGLFEVIASYWGITKCYTGGSPTEGKCYCRFITADFAIDDPPYIFAGTITNDYGRIQFPLEDYLDLENQIYQPSDQYVDTGSALIRATVVPIPASVWLFGSGLFGLLGMARKKSHAE